MEKNMKAHVWIYICVCMCVYNWINAVRQKLTHVDQLYFNKINFKNKIKNEKTSLVRLKCLDNVNTT